MKSINVVVVGRISPSWIKIVLEKLEKIFRYEFDVYARITPDEKCYISDRGQYDASCLLHRVLEYPGYRVIGITDVDITVPHLNFVFGLAVKKGRGAVVSTYRLRTGNMDRYLLRLKKEIMHELGHTFGLGHCRNHCVMKFSNSVFDVDNKPDYFCEKCRGNIEEDIFMGKENIG